MKKKSSGKESRMRRTPQFKAEAIALADAVGVVAAARDLGIHTSQLYDWRRKQRKAETVSQWERDQGAEIARLKRQLARKEEEVAILKKAARSSQSQQWLACYQCQEAVFTRGVYVRITLRRSSNSGITGTPW